MKDILLTERDGIPCVTIFLWLRKQKSEAKIHFLQIPALNC